MAVFAAVVRSGGFTAAARRLGCSKQNLSDRVAKLERELGVRLLERTSRTMRPTEVGARFFDHCASLVSQADEAVQEARQARAEPAGLLRLASTVAFGHAYLVEIIAEFLGDWPKVSVEALFVDRPVHLIDEGFDLAFWFERPEDSSFVARRVGGAFMYYAASPSYLARHGAPASSSEWEGVRCIAWPTRPWRLPGGKAAKVEPVLTVNTAQAALGAALAGAGVARLPSVLLEGPVQQGELRLLFGGEPALETDVYAVYPSGKYLAPKVRRFLELVAKRVRPMLALHPGAKAPSKPSAQRQGKRIR